MAKRRKANRQSTAFTRSLLRHADPANFALHMVALPFILIGLLTHRIELLLIAGFYILSGSAYAYFGAGEIKQIWVTLFKNDVNKWFSSVSFALFAVGLWQYDLAVLLVALTLFLFGLLYSVIVEY